MENAEKKIGYVFNNKELLRRALTHSSFANENKASSGSNERLEFLGDSVLGLIVSDYIFRLLPDVDEGQLSKFRASLVCEQSLYEISKNISLSSLVLLGRGEEMTGGRERPSVISDAFEAIIAAIYLDAGMETARKWVINLMRGAIEDVAHGHRYNDYKTMLQEKFQKGSSGKVTYRTIGEYGMDHNKTFEVEVLVDDSPRAVGKGHNKKEAEQNAAKKVLDGMDKTR